MLPTIVAICFGLVCFAIGFATCAVLSANRFAEDMDRAIEDAYSDGYEQRREDEAHGIHRLPTHRP